MSKTHLHVQSPVSSKQLYLQNQSTAGGLAFLKYRGGVIDIVGKGQRRHYRGGASKASVQ